MKTKKKVQNKFIDNVLSCSQIRENEMDVVVKIKTEASQRYLCQLKDRIKV